MTDEVTAVDEYIEPAEEPELPELEPSEIDSLSLFGSRFVLTRRAAVCALLGYNFVVFVSSFFSSPALSWIVFGGPIALALSIAFGLTFNSIIAVYEVVAILFFHSASSTGAVPHGVWGFFKILFDGFALCSALGLRTPALMALAELGWDLVCQARRQRLMLEGPATATAQIDQKLMEDGPSQY